MIAAHKPMFIDKPLASTLEDAREIARLAKEAGVPWFSSSSLRYGEHRRRRNSRTRQAHLGSGYRRASYPARSLLVRDPSDRVLYTLMGRGCET